MQREAIVRGPAIVTWNSLVFYSAGDIKLTLEQGTMDVPSSAYGVVAKRVKTRAAKVSFTPVGHWLTGLWPYAATLIGASIYGAADKDLIIKPLDTSKSEWVVYNAAITKLPTINLSTTKTLVGDVEFTALGKENTLPSAADSLVKLQANSNTDTSFDPSLIKTQPYSAAWGAVWTGIETVAGWEVSFNLSLKDVVSDTYGVIDKTLSGLEVVAKCEPLTVTEAQLITALGMDRAMGGGLNTGNDLVITGTGVSVTVKNAVVQGASPVFGSEANRLGMIEFTAARKFTTGVPDAMYVVA